MKDRSSFVCRLWRNAWTSTLRAPVRLFKSKTSLFVDSWKNSKLLSIWEIRRYSCYDSLTRTTNSIRQFQNTIPKISSRTNNLNKLGSRSTFDPWCRTPFCTFRCTVGIWKLTILIPETFESRNLIRNSYFKWSAAIQMFWSMSFVLDQPFWYWTVPQKKFASICLLQWGSE